MSKNKKMSIEDALKGKKTIKESVWNWFNTSRLILAIVMLAIGVSYTVGYYESRELVQEYSGSMTIINDHFENKEVNIESKGDGAVVPTASQVTPSEQERDNGSTGTSSPSEEIGEFSAYNSEVGQTDASPFIMANGKRVYDGAIANNCLDFGSKVEIAGKVYTVEDRMNSRYGCEHFDIWMENKIDALKFGRRQLSYIVIK